MKQFAIVLLALATVTVTSFGQDKDTGDTTETILISEPIPEYPGGVAQMNNFIRHNLERPRGFKHVKGTVYIGFNVNEDGSLSDFTVVKGLIKSFDDSALSTVMMMPHWIPAKRNGNPIKTKMVVPLKFD